MKKKLFIVCIFAFAAMLICGCDSLIEKRASIISELRDVAMCASGKLWSVELISGTREEPFDIDGVSEEKTDFTVVTLTPLGEDNAEYSYELRYGESVYRGEFSQHPFKKTFSFELAVRVEGSAALAVMSSDGSAETFALSEVRGDEEIDATVALEIAEIRLKDSIRSFSSGGKLNCEIFVRYIKNPINGDGGYYWYVAFVPERYVVYAVLIDPVTKEVVAVRE